MIIDWNVDRVIDDCQRMYYGANDPYVTGWNNWPCKQDLYRVQFALEDMLKNCPAYGPEQEWLAEQQLERDQRQMWSTLTAKKSR